MSVMTVEDGKRITVGLENKKAGIGFAPEQLKSTITKMAAETETKNRIGTEGETLKGIGTIGRAMIGLVVGTVTGGLALGGIMAAIGIAAGLPALIGPSASKPQEAQPSIKPGVSLQRDSKMSSPQLREKA